jgi:RNA polymerase sigma factor (sigma-70 family)
LASRRDQQSSRRLARKSDVQLLELARRRLDADAFGAFYLRHQHAVVSYLWRQTGSQDVAQDLAAETFATAFDKLDSFDPARGEPRGWLFGIAKIALLSSYRRGAVERATRTKLGLTVAEHTEEEWQAVQSRLEAALPSLLRGLERLSPLERDTVIARIVDEQDYAEIAQAQGSSEAAVRQRVSRGLKKLADWTMRGEQ